MEIIASEHQFIARSRVQGVRWRIGHVNVRSLSNAEAERERRSRLPNHARLRR